MTTKQLVLELLEKHRGSRISGESIASLLKVSRNMIWRAINELRKDGYIIEAATNKGYCLTGDNDILSIAGIKPFLTSGEMAEYIHIYNEIDSTNTAAKALAAKGADHGTILIANQQSAGKGRFNRRFFSPPGGGLYMSLILSPDRLHFINPTAITAYAAVCVCQAIETVCQLAPAIKWVNDIFFNGKKIGGILTEATIGFENRDISEIILGIGINVSTKTHDFPEELQNIAGSLYPEDTKAVTRNRLAAEIINRLLTISPPTEPELFRQYKKRLFMLKTDVIVVQGKRTYPAKALDIDEMGQLIVQEDNGTLHTISSGEIKIF